MSPFERSPRSVLDDFPVARRVGALLQRLPKLLVLVICYALLLLIAWVDYSSTPLHVTLLMYYLVPIFLTAWFAGPIQAVVIAVLCGVLNLAIDLSYLNNFPNQAWPIVNDVVASVIYIFAARIISLVRALILVEQSLARTDPTTGAANRRAFFEMVEHELNRARRMSEPLTLVYIDLDEFKTVNDRWGHNVGDIALRTVVATLSKYTRTTDLVARLGGDEFAVFLPNAGLMTAKAAVERLQTELLAAMKQKEWPITFSMGAVTLAKAPDSSDDMLRQADALMYMAKHLGKNRLEYKLVAV
jgi:diguanylate cyclase (GGDEF)-like protein